MYAGNLAGATLVVARLKPPVILNRDSGEESRERDALRNLTGSFASLRMTAFFWRDRRAGASPAPTALHQTAGDVVGATLEVARKKAPLVRGGLK